VRQERVQAVKTLCLGRVMTHQLVKTRTRFTDRGLSSGVLGIHVTGKTGVTSATDKRTDMLRAEYNRPIRCNRCSEISWIQMLSRTTQGGKLIGRMTEIRSRQQPVRAVAYPGILFGAGGSTKSVEDKGQRERESGGGSTLVRGSAQFANEWNPYSY
jgi:hypothetical protein